MEPYFLHSGMGLIFKVTSVTTPKVPEMERTHSNRVDRAVDLKLMKNTDLSVKIQVQKCFTEIMEKLVLENNYKIVVPLIGAAYAAPIKGRTIL